MGEQRDAGHRKGWINASQLGSDKQSILTLDLDKCLTSDRNHKHINTGSKPKTLSVMKERQKG